MASVNALTTVALSGGSLPQGFGAAIAALFLLVAIFSFPRLYKYLLRSDDKHK